VYAQPPAVSGRAMKKPKSSDPDMRDEYDFSNAVRSKYAKRFAKGTNIIVLEPEIAEVFPDAKAVNDALRPLAKIVRKRQKETAP